MPVYEVRYTVTLIKRYEAKSKREAISNFDTYGADMMNPVVIAKKVAERRLCKDCKHFSSPNYCILGNRAVDREDFCNSWAWTIRVSP